RASISVEPEPEQQQPRQNSHLRPASRHCRSACPTFPSPGNQTETPPRCSFPDPTARPSERRLLPRFSGPILGGRRREDSAASLGNKLGGLGRFVELFRSAKGSG